MVRPDLFLLLMSKYEIAHEHRLNCLRVAFSLVDPFSASSRGKLQDKQ
jgi:hypothetical protein